MLKHGVEAARPQRALDPIDRFSEILFGLIMVLTFTGSISAAESGREEIRVMLYGSIGCNLAWGIIDAVMYLFQSLSERGRGIIAVRAIRQAKDPAEAHRIIAEALPPLAGAMMSQAELEALRQRIGAMTDLPDRPTLTRADFRSALAVLLLVFCSTFPVVIPFIFMSDAPRALRVSNGIAVIMLFVLGFSLGRHMGARPWRLGLAMVLIGMALVGITMALGG